MQWNIGANIREETETRLGVNKDVQYKLPQELEAKHNPDGKRNVFLSPEIRYRVDTPWVTSEPELIQAKAKAYEQQLTGRLRLVNYDDGHKLGEAYEWDTSKLTRISTRASKPSDSPAELGTAETERNSALATVAAAPFDYLIDPALTIVSSPLFGLFYIVAYTLSV